MMMMMVTTSEVWFSVFQRKNSHDDGNNQLCKEMRSDPTTSQSKVVQGDGLGSHHLIEASIKLNKSLIALVETLGKNKIK